MGGFTLVELMVALVLGLIVTAAALAMFLSDRQVYQTTENLGRVQETVRTAYELMARDMRESAGNACESGLRTSNTLRNPATRWWSNFDASVMGYDGGTAFPDQGFGTGTGQRIANTDALEIKSAVNDGVTIVSHNAPAANFQVNTINHGISSGDIVMVCDFDHAALLQVTNAQPGINATIVHNNGGAVVPGNCSKGLGFPTDCSSPLGAQYAFGPNAIIARARMHRWYVGANSRGGRSLFEATVVNNAGTPEVAAQEIAEGVQDMQLEYLVAGATAYVNADSVTAAQWAGTTVLAVRVVITLQGEQANAGGDAVQRTLEHTVTLRNRVP
jgi:type IV pilus assembly protein PilW